MTNRSDQTSPANPKPNLFIVGAPKCGTSAWREYLQSRPDVYFSILKEPHFFCFDLEWRYVYSEEEYLKLFEDSGSAKIRGESSVRYLCSDLAAKEIRKFNPDAKILIFVRAQEDYLPSLHNQMLYRGNECIKDFERAWKLSGKRDSTNIGQAREPKFLDYKALGRFSEQVERYFAVFPAEQIRVFHVRDWSRDPRQTYLEILRFLALPDDGRNEFSKINEAKHHRAQWLARLLIKPPQPIRQVGRLLKRIFGTRLDSIVGFALQANRREGYLGKASDPLREEIRAYYTADNALLEPRIWRPEHSVPHQQASA